MDNGVSRFSNWDLGSAPMGSAGSIDTSPFQLQTVIYVLLALAKGRIQPAFTIAWQALWSSERSKNWLRKWKPKRKWPRFLFRKRENLSSPRRVKLTFPLLHFVEGDWAIRDDASPHLPQSSCFCKGINGLRAAFAKTIAKHRRLRMMEEDGASIGRRWHF